MTHFNLSCGQKRFQYQSTENYLKTSLCETPTDSSKAIGIKQKNL